MKKFASLFLGLCFLTVINAQDELAFMHQTIIAKAQEMKTFDPVYLDLEEEQEVLAEAIVQMLIDKTEGHIIAEKLTLAAKTLNQEEMTIMRWAIREATIRIFNLEDIPQARTWTFDRLLESESAGSLEKTNQVKDLFESGKSVMSSVE